MKIYHYTDLNGLKGIIESHSLWATNFRFLNDFAEIDHGISAFENALPSLENKLGKENTDFLLSEFRKYKSRSFRDIYNISFCEEPDLLSQWRGYGAFQGVCLAFDSDKLAEKLDFQGCQYVKNSVFYTQHEATTEAENEIIRFLKEDDFFAKAKETPHYGTVGANVMFEMLIPFFKDERFRDEKEFRIAVQASKVTEKVKFRVNQHGLIPYIEIKTREEPGVKENLPLISVTVGPCKDADLIEKGVRFLLDSKGYTGVTVLSSSVPFRA